MTHNTQQLLPLEYWLKEKSKDQNHFPHGMGDQFDRYQQIKDYCAREVYKWVGAGTSAEDGSSGKFVGRNIADSLR
ncbi:MAG: hypothetical protein JMN26_15110 [gamma proteobacterium endosymbiont of Lamellibrachia anaximandri]|nr:hypothetical protein [gamma proteobacterium endosymbiont of Lamellibrachia anaximandri]